MRKRISIHAPVKGATLADPELVPEHPISIHAPVKGATYMQQIKAEDAKFQSTLP